MGVPGKFPWVVQRHPEPPYPPPPPVTCKALFLPTTVHLYVPDLATTRHCLHSNWKHFSWGLYVKRLAHSESVNKPTNWTQLLSDSFKLELWIVVTARMNLEQKLWVGDTHCRSYSTDDPPTATQVVGTYIHYYIPRADCPQSSNAWYNTKLEFSSTDFS